MTVPNNANTFLPPSPVVPEQLLITNITNAVMAVITVASLMDSIYVPNQLIRLTVPFDYGMFQADGLTVKIYSVNGLNFTVYMDSTNFDPFVVPMQTNFTVAPASLSPAGSQNLYNFSTVPFHSLANVGN